MLLCSASTARLGRGDADEARNSGGEEERARTGGDDGGLSE